MHLVGCARASTLAPGCSYAVSLVMSQSLTWRPTTLSLVVVVVVVIASVSLFPVSSWRS
jgi:hypothetical protein